MPGITPGEQSVPVPAEGGMDAPEFGAAFVGAGSDGHIIAFPGVSSEVPGDSISGSTEGGGEIPHQVLGFVGGDVGGAGVQPVYPVVPKCLFLMMQGMKHRSLLLVCPAPSMAQITVLDLMEIPSMEETSITGILYRAMIPPVTPADIPREDTQKHLWWQQHSPVPRKVPCSGRLATA